MRARFLRRRIASLTVTAVRSALTRPASTGRSSSRSHSRALHGAALHHARYLSSTPGRVARQRAMMSQRCRSRAGATVQRDRWSNFGGRGACPARCRTRRAAACCSSARDHRAGHARMSSRPLEQYRPSIGLDQTLVLLRWSLAYRRGRDRSSMCASQRPSKGVQRLLGHAACIAWNGYQASRWTQVRLAFERSSGHPMAEHCGGRTALRNAVKGCCSGARGHCRDEHKTARYRSTCRSAEVAATDPQRCARHGTATAPVRAPRNACPGASAGRPDGPACARLCRGTCVSWRGIRPDPLWHARRRNLRRNPGELRACRHERAASVLMVDSRSGRSTHEQRKR